MGSVWLILGVPAGKRRSGFTLVAFLLWLQLFQQCFSSRRKLRLFSFNSKKATAAIPNATSKMYILVHFWLQVCYTNLLLLNTTDILVRSELTSVSKFAHEFFASKKHRYCMESPPSMAVLKMYILVHCSTTSFCSVLPRRAGVLSRNDVCLCKLASQFTTWTL